MSPSLFYPRICLFRLLFLRLNQSKSDTFLTFLSNLILFYQNLLRKGLVFFQDILVINSTGFSSKMEEWQQDRFIKDWKIDTSWPLKSQGSKSSIYVLKLLIRSRRLWLWWCWERPRTWFSLCWVGVLRQSLVNCASQLFLHCWFWECRHSKFIEFPRYLTSASLLFSVFQYFIDWNPPHSFA